jgi:hypothetical protein
LKNNSYKVKNHETKRLHAVPVGGENKLLKNGEPTQTNPTDAAVFGCLLEMEDWKR